MKYTRPGTHHARYIEGSIPYHVMSKTIRGALALKPSVELTQMLIGVLARAKSNWPSIQLFAVTVLSNHFHMMLQGPPKDFSSFVGFFKRETSRRLGQMYGESGPLWHSRYRHTALPTAQAQLGCLRYILENSVKEDLVERCGDWPGVHSATALTQGTPLRGRWFDATAFGRAKHRGKGPDRSEFWVDEELHLDAIPAWSQLSIDARLKKAKKMVDAIDQAASTRRSTTGARVLGAREVLAQRRTQTRMPPKPSWYSVRRRCMCAWVDFSEAAVQQFVARYRRFQSQFRLASDCLFAGLGEEPFPIGAWKPATMVSN